jgi:formiminotetrahydrofolate cyclodeaminase
MPQHPGGLRFLTGVEHDARVPGTLLEPAARSVPRRVELGFNVPVHLLVGLYADVRISSASCPAAKELSNWWPDRIGDMFDARMSDWLGELADRTPSPGGGAVAALCAASAAALLEMVANYTVGKKWADREEAMKAIIAETAELRARSTQLAVDDAAAFGAVGDAYGLPRATDEEKAARSETIQQATLGAAEPPIQVGRVAMRIVALADEMVDPANPNVLSDVGVAAATARAALSGSITNITVNAALLTDDDAARGLLDKVGELERAMQQADDVAARIVERLKK